MCRLFALHPLGNLAQEYVLRNRGGEGRVLGHPEQTENPRKFETEGLPAERFHPILINDFRCKPDFKRWWRVAVFRRIEHNWRMVAS